MFFGRVAAQHFDHVASVTATVVSEEHDLVSLVDPRHILALSKLTQITMPMLSL